MAVSVRLSDRDEKLFKKYAEMHGISLSDLFRDSVMEKIEDEYDLQCFDKAMKEYEADPVTYTHEEIGKMLGLI